MKNLNVAYLNGAEGMIRRSGASSGGSGESGGSGNGESSNWRYFDLSKIMSVGGQIFLKLTATLISYYDTSKNKVFIMPAGQVLGMNTNNISSDIYVAIDFNLPISYVYMYAEYQVITPQELFPEFEILESDITIGEITKEQFYSLE